MSRRGRARGQGRQRHEEQGVIREIKEAGTCDACADPECRMVLVELRGGARDGKRYWVGGCKLGAQAKP